MNEFNKIDVKTLESGIYKKEVVFKQGMFSYSIDELIEKYEFEIPNYIKIDVDSIEDKIVYGANKTLSNENVKGVLIELDEAEVRTQEMIDFLAERGLKLKEKRRSAMFDKLENNKMYNFIFVR